MGHMNPCVEYCEHGICLLKTRESLPTCLCMEGWGGHFCEKPSRCINYCKNGGHCSISENMIYCDCSYSFEGPTCEKRKDSYTTTTTSTTITSIDTNDKKDMKLPSEHQPEEDSPAITIILTVIIICIVAVSFVATYFFVKKRQLFTHERLQENDFNNPMYQDRDAEPFALGTDKVCDYLLFY